jgi:hypothetical protein
MKIDTLDIIIMTLSTICIIIIIIQIFRHCKVQNHITCIFCKKKSQGLSISNTNYTVNEMIEVILNDDKIKNVENTTDIYYTKYNKKEDIKDNKDIRKKDYDNDSLEEISLL